MGISSASTAPGDRVYILLGGDVPFMLRETAVKSKFTPVGEAYVHGVIDGELWERTGDDEQPRPVGGNFMIEDVLLV